MLIWGSKGKEKVLEQGRFFCPKCNAERLYIHKRVSKQFTLYFIPLFETKKLGEVVECQTCKGGLTGGCSNQAILKIVHATRYDLLHGTPSDVVKSRLVEHGLKNDMADAIIKMAQDD